MCEKIFLLSFIIILAEKLIKLENLNFETKIFFIFFLFPTQTILFIFLPCSVICSQGCSSSVSLKINCTHLKYKQAPSHCSRDRNSDVVNSVRSSLTLCFYVFTLQLKDDGRRTTNNLH